MKAKTKIDQLLEKARKQGFKNRAISIIKMASILPQNPYDFFGRSLRRSWSYAYFERLHMAGFLKIVNPPNGRQGHHWYIVDLTNG